MQCTASGAASPSTEHPAALEYRTCLLNSCIVSYPGPTTQACPPAWWILSIASWPGSTTYASHPAWRTSNIASCPGPTTQACHPERSEGSVSLVLSHGSVPVRKPSTPSYWPGPATQACHPERSEGSGCLVLTMGHHKKQLHGPLPPGDDKTRQNPPKPPTFSRIRA
jgi:hypothetical protein